MIILKHLTVERFRLLREVNLHFPQRGSILIQGPNEAGKSALLESLYFALYGEALFTERKKRVLDDLILYGAATAVATLTCAVGATEITVSRTIERDKGQSVSLSICKPGLPEEGPITRLITANERIIKELGQMDGPALRNSCLIEQKGLGRLENLRGVEREATIRKLLGIEQLTRMTEHFKVTPLDERLLQEATERLRLAETQVRIPEQRAQLAQVKVALDAVTVAEDLAEVAQQQEEVAEQETQLEHITARRNELKTRQSCIQQLKKADATLAEIITAYEAIAEARRKLPILEKQIADLEHREQEELPAQERRVRELAELMQMFGTLQRMSSDLLTAVEAIKVLEHDERHYQDLQEELKNLTAQVAHAQERVAEAQRARDAAEERRRDSRPLLEERVERLKALGERLGVLREVEEQYRQHLELREAVSENERRLLKAQQDLRDTEQELELVESEAKQAQQDADDLERRRRQLSLRRHLEEWQRLKGLSQGLADAEQHVRIAHQQQERLTLATLEARRIARRHLLISGACGLLFVLCAIVAFAEVRNMAVVAIVAIIIALASAGMAGVSFQSYSKARKEEAQADQQMQKAMNTVSMMVAARESAIRSSGNQEALAQVEREIQSLGGALPRSSEDVARVLQQMPDTGESLTDLQKQIQAKRDEANAARNQVNVTMEAVANLRKERKRLDEQRVQEGWDDIDSVLRTDQIALERMQQEIVVLSGQEGLPQSSINARVPISNAAISFSGVGVLSSPDLQDESTVGVPKLEALVESTVQATEHELAALDVKASPAGNRHMTSSSTSLSGLNINLDVRELQEQVRTQQEALDILARRKRMLEERLANYEQKSPIQQLEQMREQQNTLRNALQLLQDSLRQRVKALGLLFGQAAASSAETAARKQFEELHILLGSKIALEAKRTHYLSVLKTRQQSLAELYKQLAKYSNSLGSWIVPANPFAETLASLRSRCQRELHEADEQNTLQELEKLQQQEGAVQAKIALCRQDIEAACGRINALLLQHERACPAHYTRAETIVEWPLLSEYTEEDRTRLENELLALEQELTRLEEQEQALHTQLQTGGTLLNLEQTRARKEQQERSYETKKRGNQLVKAVNERLVRKLLTRTEHHVQQLLPLLTSGRYHDVHLATEAEEEATAGGGPFRLSVWDSAAGDYVSPSALSGGAADQLSLALRLAFAIAVLPRELSVAPGFIILDEPLSYFDRGRIQSLADVVTGEALSRHFEQILLISQSGTFDQAIFPYHISMENGMVIESNLPVVQVPSSTRQTGPLSLSIEQDDEEEEADATVVMAAVAASTIAGRE